MRRPLQLGAVLLLVVAALAACGGDGGGSGEADGSLEDALRRMVLQPEDLPPGFVQGDESLITNEDLAALSADPKARNGELKRWGRILGFEVTYQRSDATSDELPVQGINVSSNLYRTVKGAGESFADAARKAEEKDWATDYAGLTDFQQEEIEASGLADQIVWLHLSGFLPPTNGRGALVTDDHIFFRVGRERGFLRVQAISSETGDRQHILGTVEGWLRALIENVEDVLAEPGLQEDG